MTPTPRQSRARNLPPVPSTSLPISFSWWLCLDARFPMSFRRTAYLPLKVLFWEHFLFSSFSSFRKKGRKERTAALTSLRVTRTPDFYATLQVPFSDTMAGSLTMSCVYSKQPACQSEAWAFAQCLFSVVIRHVRFSHSIWEIILVFLKSPAFLIIFFSCLFGEQ